MRVSVKNKTIVVSSVGNPILLLNQNDAAELHRRLGEILVSKKKETEENFFFTYTYNQGKKLFGDWKEPSPVIIDLNTQTEI
jgi:hypothetical protein